MNGQETKRPPAWEATWLLEARAGVEPTYTDLQSGYVLKHAGYSILINLY